MADKKIKYIIMLVVFTVLFFISMLVCIVAYRSVARDFRHSSISGRKSALELDEKMYGPDHIYSTLYFDKDYEEEFDDYWDYANAYRAYIQGRYGYKTEEALDKMQSYVDSCKIEGRREAVTEYMEIVRQSN